MDKFVDKCGETCWWHCDEFLFLIVFSAAVERSEKVPQVATTFCRLWHQLVTFFDDIVIPCKVAMVVIFEIVPLVLCQSVKMPRNPPLHLINNHCQQAWTLSKVVKKICLNPLLFLLIYQVGILSQYLTLDHALRPPGGQSLSIEVTTTNKRDNWSLLSSPSDYCWVGWRWKCDFEYWLNFYWIFHFNCEEVKQISKGIKMYFLVFPWALGSAEYELPLLWCPMKLFHWKRNTIKLEGTFFFRRVWIRDFSPNKEAVLPRVVFLLFGIVRILRKQLLDNLPVLIFLPRASPQTLSRGSRCRASWLRDSVRWRRERGWCWWWRRWGAAGCTPARERAAPKTFSLLKFLTKMMSDETFIRCQFYGHIWYTETENTSQIL